MYEGEKCAILCVIIVLWGYCRMKEKETQQFQLYTEAGELLKGVAEVWTKYPRPQMRRVEWQSLNGIWNLEGKSVRVPFPPQSLLAEYTGEIRDFMTYERNFAIEHYNEEKRTLLHFGAVDQIAEVYLNGKYVGKHEGGYLPFVFDVTENVKQGDNQLVVMVKDELDRDYPYGKQCRNRGGMWYTPTSGIWKSVWIEQVPKTYIKSVKITPDLQGIQLNVESGDGTDFQEVCAKIKLHTGDVFEHVLQEGEGYINLRKIRLSNGESYEPILWDTKNPYLYSIVIQAGEDVVESYFGLRTVEIKAVNSVNRLCLNGKPIFMHGVLDQGYFSDGIVTPAEEEEFKRDILRMKKLGFNMLRKHIKIEPECFYYDCDRYGMLVIQDMVNNGVYSFWRDTLLPTIGECRKKDTGKGLSKRQKKIFEEHMQDTLEVLHNHPCIIGYTIFNEGWGQFESDRLYRNAQKADSTRVYDATSGWFAQKQSDFDSVHLYFGPAKLHVKNRPLLLSEFGGYSYVVKGHCFSDKKYGYGTCKKEEELTHRIVKRYEKLVMPYVKKGLCGSIYTQVSDVEDEVNGFYTYDRKVCKVNQDDMKILAAKIEQLISDESM